MRARQLGGNLLLLSFSNDLFWFKIFGRYGLYFTTRPNFSQRNNYAPTLKIGKVYISPLGKDGLVRKRNVDE